MDPLDHLRQLVLDRLGLVTISREDVDAALGRMFATQAEPLAVLASRVERSTMLFQELAGQLTLSESYFARHPDQIDAVMQHVLPQIATGNAVNIWSAGCARGEEPYTIAMRLFESCGPDVMPRVHIMGSDIDGSAINAAKSGLFNQWSLRTAAQDILRHFERQSTGQYRIRRSLQGWVEFHHTSIQDHLLRLAPQSLDVILFRNVGIYLSGEALQDIHRAFYRVMGASGLLVQAATDPMPSPQWFHAKSLAAPGLLRPVHPHDAGPGKQPLVNAGETSRRAADTCVHRRRSMKQTSVARRRALSLSPQSSAAPRTAPGAVAQPKGLLPSVQEQIEQGDTQGAISALRSALYLTPEDHLARYWYCIALSAAAWNGRALQQLRQLKAQLSGGASDHVLSDDATTIGELRQAVEELLEEIQ